MFTGIIRHRARVSRRAGGIFEIAGRLPPARIGDSVAVNGVCLTVVKAGGSGARRRFAFDLSGETLRRTTLGRLSPGSPVNVEKPLRVGDELGGHMVQGHVDGVGRVEKITPAKDGALYRFSLPAALARWMVPKGSVTVDGISLTVVERRKNAFTVAVIPHTEKNTTLALSRPGDPVNVEIDVIAKYVRQLKGNNR